MLKKALLAAAVLFVLLTGGLYLWARSVLTQDTVRTAVAAQLAEALGQPVTIGGIGASLTPRLTVALRDVAIGQPSRIRLREVQLGTDMRALFSRRIEHATARVDGADIELPLPPFATPGSPAGQAPGTAPSPGGPAAPAGPAADPADGAGALPLEIVSIDEIVVSDIRLTSSGRILRGTLELVPQSTTAVTIRRLSLTADDTAIEVTGRITDLAGPVGELAIEAGELNVDALMAFFQEFSAGATTTASADGRSGPETALHGRPSDDTNGATTPDIVRIALVQPSPAAPPSRVQLTVDVAAKKATSGGLALEALTAHALVRDEDITVEPMSFMVLGGRYDGRAVVRTPDAGDTRFALTGKLTDVDMRAVNAFTHSADTITGTLSGALDLTASGADAAAAARTARGVLRAEIRDGVVKNLGLVRSVIVATSGRGDGGGAASGLAALSQLSGSAPAAQPAGSGNTAASASRDEKFTRLGATLAIADQVASTSDLRFESPDVLMSGGGTLRLDGSAIDLKTQLQLSEALTQQAGRDLVRYTQQGGRVTLPATITGSAINPVVRIDIGDLASRAARNAANEQLEKGRKQLENELKKGLGGLFGKKPK
jgi:hypothetical protein